jgi:hypothetical protein
MSKEMNAYELDCQARDARKQCEIALTVLQHDAKTAGHSFAEDDSDTWTQGQWQQFFAFSKAKRPDQWLGVGVLFLMAMQAEERSEKQSAKQTRVRLMDRLRGALTR